MTDEGLENNMHARTLHKSRALKSTTHVHGLIYK